MTAATDAIDLRFARAHAALATCAVTGTNGKTTTTSMVASIVRAAGEPSAHLTTLGAWVAGEQIQAADPTAEFLATVEAAVVSGVRTLALEVTSKALAGGLARRWPPTVAVFTNLTRDHLDMHGTPEAYLAAKAQLFLALRPGGTAVLNADDPSAALIRDAIETASRGGVTVRGFSTLDPAADLYVADIQTSARGTRMTLGPSPVADDLRASDTDRAASDTAPGVVIARPAVGAAPGVAIALPVVGAVHALNAAAAVLAARALGYPGDAIRRGLAAFRGVPGRFEVVASSPLVVVDYAHTPDGLDGTLRTARDLVGPGGRLVCVFGCGGNRDRGKRPAMGATVHRLADLAVLTSDNPRYEPSEAIAADVRAGVGDDHSGAGEDHSGAEWHERLDRPRAIEWAIANASPADVVVIAGKGHEAVQEIGDRVLPMSDAALARAAHATRSR